jgi:triosephosphate isomerase
MRKKIVAGNWKMNTTLAEGQALASEIIHMVEDETDGSVQVVLIPPFTHLYPINKLIGSLRKKHIYLGAQDCSAHEKGAYTGEVSAAMLQSVGVDYVIVGHSERREYHAENHALLAQKARRVLEHGMQLIFCCGEPLSVREAGNYLEYVEVQLRESLFELEADLWKRIVIAYEPVWAIGTGKTATPEQAQEVHAHIRSLIAGHYNKALAHEVSILYGGSCKPENAAELFAQADIDGGLIGGASLKSRSFVDIIKACQ